MGSFQIVSQYISLRTVQCDDAEVKKKKKKVFFFASVKGGGDYLLNTGFSMQQIFSYGYIHLNEKNKR